jgi:thiol-disulfide isomerase/thioredoxin|tara:strand:+ start:4218 stop:4628 length:411 start_codon:yes stop_codon:yes gene_type:complete
MRTILLFLMPFLTFAQSDVPEKYWIDDSNFDEIISHSSAFGDDESTVVVIEFWAKFNEANCFAEWDQLEDASYYRVDIAKAPNAKKEYRIRMAPTLIIFKDGVKEVTFKAGLDLELPADLEEIQEAINEVNAASKF